MVGLAGRTGLLADYWLSQDQIVAPTPKAMAQGDAKEGLRTVMDPGRGLAINTVPIQFLDSRADFYAGGLA